VKGFDKMAVTIQQLDLFGKAVDIYETAKKRFGVWPMTVWDLDHSNQIYQELKNTIGDDGLARQECFTRATQDKSVYRGKITESIFNPQVAIWALNCFAPHNGKCFDPFGGGGTRAIIAAKHGLDYVGLEIRLKEVRATQARCEKAGIFNKVKILHGDARFACQLTGENWADFLITCPPYWNLEKYNGGNSDLSMLPTYIDFIKELGIVVAECAKILRPGALAVWIVGLHRDTNGELLTMHHDLARLHKKEGFILREEIILAHRNTGAIQRVGNFEKGNRWLVRNHEYALVFKKSY